MCSVVAGSLPTSLLCADMSKTNDSFDLKAPLMGSLQMLWSGVVTFSTCWRWNINRLSTIAETGHDILIGTKQRIRKGHYMNIPTQSYQIPTRYTLEKRVMKKLRALRPWLSFNIW